MLHYHLQYISYAGCKCNLNIFHEKDQTMTISLISPNFIFSKTLSQFSGFFMKNIQIAHLSIQLQLTIQKFSSFHRIYSHENGWLKDVWFMYIFHFFCVCVWPFRLDSFENKNNLTWWKIKTATTSTTSGEANHCRSAKTGRLHCISIITALYIVQERQRYYHAGMCMNISITAIVHGKCSHLFIKWCALFFRHYDIANRI